MIFWFRFWRLPISLRAAMAATSSLFVINLLWAYSQLGTKIDQGLATLLGAIIGLGVVGWQTNRGFKNLIRSQENASKLEREARLHRFELERSAIRQDEDREQELLMSGLRAEIVSLMTAATTYASSHETFARIYKGLHESGAAGNMREITFPAYKSEFFKMNIGKLGLLGTSLAADVIRIYAMATDERKVVWETAPSNAIIALAYGTTAITGYKFQSDLYHVAMRIRAREERRDDPGTLSETEAERHRTIPKIEELVPKKLF